MASKEQEQSGSLSLLVGLPIGVIQPCQDEGTNSQQTERKNQKPGALMDLGARLLALEQLLRDGVVFELYHLCEPDSLYLYGVSEYQATGSGGQWRVRVARSFPGGSTTETNSLDTRNAAKQMVRILRDNCDVLVQDICGEMAKLDSSQRKGHRVQVKWTTPVDHLNVHGGTLWCSDAKRMAEINRDMDVRRETARKERQRVAPLVLREVQASVAWRKESGNWDDDAALAAA